MHRTLTLLLAGCLVLACSDDDGGAGPAPPTGIGILTGNNQSGLAGSALAAPLVVTVMDEGEAAEGVEITWSVVEGGGAVSSTSVLTNATGLASVTATLGDAGYGPNRFRAQVAGTTASVDFSAHAFLAFGIAGGGNNVPERYTSDLWLHGDFGYSGTWGARAEIGNALKVWALDGSGAPTAGADVIVPNIGTVSDVEVSPDGAWLVLSAEGGANAGLHVYSLADPAVPAPVDNVAVGDGYHTAGLGVIDGALYAFAARNPGSPALVIHRIETDGTISTPVATVPIPANYGIHDTFVREGLAFVSAWNTGLIIYDVGDGRAGGSVASPRELGRIVTSSTASGGGARVHNAWWFHNPVRDEQRYVFVGEEGPGSIGGTSSGDLHVVDVSNMGAPTEVAFLHVNGAGAHNIWMDEPAEVLYMAFYNGGVIALDVSGELSGDLADRVIAQVAPGGAGNTYTWGVMLHRGSLYASDMLSGFWQLALPAVP